MNHKFDSNQLSSKPLTGCLGVLLLLAGCQRAQPPEFRLNMVQAVSEETPTSPEYQQEIADLLGALFGTPDEPYAPPEAGLDLGQLRMAAGPSWSDEKGYSHGLYRKHCVHCHGVTGDGRGPTARFLNPYPRDYRPAVYKFKSTYNPLRPTDEDLIRVLVNGVPGTAMPSFSLLPASEVKALAEYVKYLSIRGQMETALINYVFNDLDEGEEDRLPLDPSADPEQQEIVMEILAEIVDEWNSARQPDRSTDCCFGGQGARTVLRHTRQLHQMPWPDSARRWPARRF